MPAAADPLDVRYALAENIVLQQFPGEVVALNVRSGRFHGLNPTAARVLEALGAGRTARVEVEDIAGAAGVPVERVEQDVRGLLEGLAERGLIVPDA